MAADCLFSTHVCSIFTTVISSGNHQQLRSENCKEIKKFEEENLGDGRSARFKLKQAAELHQFRDISRLKLGEGKDLGDCIPTSGSNDSGSHSRGEFNSGSSS